MFLQKGQFGPHPHFSAIGLLVGCSSGLGSIFMGDFELVAMAVFHVIAIVIIRRDQPVISCLEEVSQHFPCFRPWGT